MLQLVSNGDLIGWLTEREDYHYSGSENEEEEHQIAGEPSSIIQAQSGDTLRRNFQQIQVISLCQVILNIKKKIQTVTKLN